jgi:hypothetical protein
MATVFLDRVNAVPLGGLDFTPEFVQWLTILADSLNEVLGDIEDLFNVLPAPQYTAAEISALAADLPDGVIVYDTTANVYVGKENGTLVQFDTSSYP